MKAQILLHIQELLAQKVLDLKSDIADAVESRNTDTKSSVGDKYETGREMMQSEIDKLEIQLGKAQEQLEELRLISPRHQSPKVEVGSLVVSNFERYFVAVGLGKVEFEGKLYYAISLASPIGQQLSGKKEGDKFNFQGRDYEILSVS